ncbi:MAG: oxidoreductase, partial [Rhodospirillales bacterium]|nr:oxidoreductase [Rhodospirillales bacterium]
LGMIGASELGGMKPTAYLINVARGPLVDYNALFEALTNNKIAGAAFDVFWSEPAPSDDPILRLENFFISPHVAGFSDVSIEHITNIMAENFRRLASGKPLVNVIDPANR